MNKLNVISLKAFKQQRECNRAEDTYGLYLKTLENGQIDAEITFLKDESCNQTFLSKGRILSEEIASRAEGTWKKSIETLNQETLRLV